MAIIPSLKKYNILLLLQTFQLWISTSTALNTSPLYRYYTRTFLLIREVAYLAREEVGCNFVKSCDSLIYRVFSGAVHWILCWKGLDVTLSRLAFVTSSPIYIITPWCSPSKIFTHLWVSGAPKKCVKSGPHLLTSALYTSIYEYAVSVTRHILMGANFAPLGVIAIQDFLLMSMCKLSSSEDGKKQNQSVHFQ